MKTRVLTIALFISLLTCCASIVDTSTQILSTLNPSNGASIIIINEKGSEIFKGSTPTQVTVNKGDGSYWDGKSFNVMIKKESDEKIKPPMETPTSRWHLAENLVFDGLIRWFVVDPINGSAYTLSTNEKATTLSASATPTDKTVSIISLDNVPKNLRSKLVKIN